MTAATGSGRLRLRGTVLVTGRVRRVDPDEFRRLEELGVAVGWSFLIESRDLSGRRIRADT